jgi:hypothetical protein
MADNAHNGNAGKANAGNPSPSPKPGGQELATVKNGDLARVYGDLAR